MTAQSLGRARTGHRAAPIRRRGRLPDGQIVTAPSHHPARSADDIIKAFRAGTLDAASLSQGEMRAFWTWCRAKSASSLRRIDRHIAAGANRQARRAAHKYVGSLHARALALKSSAPKDLRSTGRCWAEDELKRQRLNREIFAQFGEINRFNAPARGGLFHQPKASGQGTRLLASFSWADKARQRLLSSALTPFASLHPSQFLLAQEPEGRGRTAACKTLLTQLGNVTDDHVFLQIDIRDFYGSISHGWLEENLPLDVRTIRRHLHTGGMSLYGKSRGRSRPTDEEIQKLGRQGIAQGSALSPLVGEMVMADILRGLTVPLGAFAVAYSDNIGIIVPSGGESDLEEHLRAAFASHGAGPFEITSSARRLTRPFKFLGYWWVVSDAGPRAFIRETEAITWEIAVTSNAMVASRRKLDLIEEYVRGKCAAWALWDGAARLRDRVLANISALREFTTYHDDGAEEADALSHFDADWEFE